MNAAAGSSIGSTLDATSSKRRLPAWAVLTALLLALVPLALFAGYTLNRYQQIAVLDEEAAGTLRGIAADISRVETIMHSLSSVHHALHDNEDALLSLSEVLRERTSWVRALGRYRQLAPAERSDFEEEMANRGLYDFRVRERLPDQSMPTAPLRDTSFPIAMLEPMAPANLHLFGADLAGIEGLSDALLSAAALNRPHVIALPSHWPAGGHLMVFQPAYRGMRVPDTAAGRRAQADGGYWLIADPEELLSAANSRAQLFDVTMHVDGGGSATNVVASQFAADVNRGWLPELYPARTLEQAWSFGDAHLSVRMSARYGVLPRVLGLTLLLLSMIAALLGLAGITMRQRAHRLDEQERSRAVVFAEREKAQRTLDALHDAVITVDAAGRLRSLNPAAAMLIGRSAQTLLGEPFDNLIALRHAEQRDESRHFDLASEIARLPDEGERRFELAPVDAIDDDAGLQAALSRTTGVDGEAGDIILILRDNSTERRFTRELEYQATHDALTGCTNRHYFERELERRASAHLASGEHYALLYMDLDQFKIVNDTAGHTAGDRLLIELTDNLRAILRDGDVLCRLGGDEFGLIIVDVDRAQAREIADRVYGLFQSLVFTHDEHAFTVRACLGLVHCEETSGETGDLLAAADIACYSAKENGRNELCEFRAEDEAMAMRSSELNWLPRLQRALDMNEFRLHAQPVYELPQGGRTGRIAHFEFLLRLAGEDGREITPWQIIQSAERYGLMRDIDRWVIRQALSQMNALATRQGGWPHDVGFSINLSGQSAADATLIDFIREQYDIYDIDPKRVWFEITETAAISHFATAVELAQQIRALGSAIALDDFGSGLSSFGYLKHLPVDVLKIDGQFVRELASNTIDREMVRAISQIARAMDIRTVAEFVEDEQTMEALTEIGIDFAQGYHIARPLPIEEAIALLEPAAGTDAGATQRAA